MESRRPPARTYDSSLLEALLSKTSRTFALSIPRLPGPTRQEVTIAYLLLRIADTLEDATLWTRARRVRALGELVSLLREAPAAKTAVVSDGWLEGPPCAHNGYLELLSETAAVFDAYSGLSPEARRVIQEHTVKTVQRMASFVERADENGELQLNDATELRDYCYAVAGIVGEMLTELFLLKRQNLRPVAPLLRKHAASFGEGLQLVNILKDSVVDAGEGRRFLPKACSREEVVALARGNLDVAGRYVRTLVDAGAPRGVIEFTALPVMLAWRTLEQLEEEGPGSKISRLEVSRIVERLEASLDCGELELPGSRHVAD